jgi:hypothetical protein
MRDRRDDNISIIQLLTKASTEEIEKYVSKEETTTTDNTATKRNIDSVEKETKEKV